MANTGRFDWHTAGGSLVQTLGKGLDLVLGYHYSQAQYADGSAHQNHLIDAGVNYNRALSFSRRTTLSFSTGTSRFAKPNPAGRCGSAPPARSGSSHEIGRTWTATLSYDRGLRFTENWLEPLFTDSASAGLSGSMSRRVQAHLGARGYAA